MSERCQIPRRAERAVLGHPGHDAGVEQREQCLHEVDAHPGEPCGQGPRPEQDHAAHHLVVEARAGPRGMAHDDRALEERAIGRVDRAVGERAESRGHPVHDRALAIEPLDGLAPRGHAPGHRRVESHRFAAASRAHHRVDRQRAAVDCDHAASSLLDPEAVERRDGEPTRRDVRYAYVDPQSPPGPNVEPPPSQPPPWPPPEAWQAPRPWPGTPPQPPRDEPAPASAAGVPGRRRWPLAALVVAALVMALAGVAAGASGATSAAASSAARLVASGDFGRALALDEEISERTGPLYAFDGSAATHAVSAGERTLLAWAAALGRAGNVDAAVALYRSERAPSFRREATERARGAPPRDRGCGRRARRLPERDPPPRGAGAARGRDPRRAAGGARAPGRPGGCGAHAHHPGTPGRRRRGPRCRREGGVGRGHPNGRQHLSDGTPGGREGGDHGPLGQGGPRGSPAGGLELSRRAHRRPAHGRSSPRPRPSREPSSTPPDRRSPGRSA